MFHTAMSNTVKSILYDITGNPWSTYDDVMNTSYRRGTTSDRGN